jgi:hypothetical protein
METEYPWLVDARVEFECTRASICIISLFGSQSRNKTAGRAVGFYIVLLQTQHKCNSPERKEREKDKLRARNTNVRRVVFVSSTRRFCVSHGFHLFPKWIGALFSLSSLADPFILASRRFYN